MKLTEIFPNKTATEVVKEFERTKPDSYDKTLQRLKKEWNVNEHRTIVDKEYLPDKELKNDKGEITKIKKVNRIAVPYQKMIVNRVVAFGFANDVKIMHDAKDESAELSLVQAIERVLYENKENGFNRKVARELYRSREVAELWYFSKSEPHDNYGFNTEYKIKCMLISPWDGNILMPYFDPYGDLIAFARSYPVTIDGEKRVLMDIYTSTETTRFIKEGSEWGEYDSGEETQPANSGVINKIPIVYAEQESAEWEDVQYDIERLELLLSKHCEINDYHAAPKTFIKGDLESVPQAGESNPIMKGGIDTDVKVLSWEHSPESVKLEIETRLENIHKFTQTADISFKSIKGLSQVSGVMLKMLFMDVHLKIMEKNEIWDTYFTRRYSVIKNMLGYLNPSYDGMNVEMVPRITPFEISDLQERINTIMTANGNKSIISRKTSMALSGLVEDAETEVEDIEAEDAEMRIMPSEPTLFNM